MMRKALTEEQHPPQGTPYRQIQAFGGMPESPQQYGFFSYALSMLAAPSRDAVGITTSLDAKAAAGLVGTAGAAELANDIWSDWVRNYTHAGLRMALGLLPMGGQQALTVNNSNKSAATMEKHWRQAALITSARLILLAMSGERWFLAMEVELSEISEVITPSYSDTMLVVRSRRWPDMLLDLTQRSRFLDELQLATNRLSGGGTVSATLFGAGGITPHTTSAPLVGLHDEHGQRVGTVAYVERELFLLMPYSPSSLLFWGAQPVNFGFLDMEQETSGSQGLTTGTSAASFRRKIRWQSRFFVLKGSHSTERQLLWCRHPNDGEAEGCLLIDGIQAVWIAESHQGDHCLLITLHSPRRPGGNARSAQRLQVALRARSLQSCEEWLEAIQQMRNLATSGTGAFW